MEPLSEWVSGPACVYVFRSGSPQRRLYLFGDVHFSYGNMCRTGEATTFNAFVERLMSGNRNSARPRLIVEYPYSTPTMTKTARGRWYLERIEQALARDSSASTRLDTVLYRLFGVSAPVTGLLGELHSKYPENAPRIIRGDIRSEPNVHAWTLAIATEGAAAVEETRKRMTDDALRRWLSAYLHDDAFCETIRCIFSTTVLGKFFVRRKGAHVIRRAWLSLKSAQDRTRVDAFHNKLVERAIKQRRTDLRAWVETTHAMLMDTYVIIQTLAAAPADVIVYAGAYHTQHYREFFEDASGFELLHAHDMRTAADGDVERCVPVPLF